MKSFLKLLVLILSIAFLNFSSKEEKTCQITGTVINSETKSILLVKPSQDWRLEKWPWLNLVELDKQNNIWQKYGADNSGGCYLLT